MTTETPSMTVEVRADRALGWTRADTVRTAVAAVVAALLLGTAWYLHSTSGEGLGGSNAALMLLVGAGLGILFERGRYCFFCIFRDLFEKGIRGDVRHPRLDRGRDDRVRDHLLHPGARSAVEHGAD